MPPPLRSIIASATRALRKHGVVGAWRNARNSKHLRAGFWDGGLLVALLKEDGAVLKGVDSYGNEYWEKMQDQHGRHRWVKYADAVDYDAASVPPEWHGWLHHITDHTPEQLEALKPTRYGLEAWDKAPKYFAKGHALHPQRRSWKHFESWQSVEPGPAQAVATEVYDAPAPETDIFEPRVEKVCWEDTVKVIPDPPPPEKVCWEAAVKIIPDPPPPEKVCWDATVKVIPGLGKISKEPTK
ncbi:hypothetical protein KC19_9G051600 [Ceratodon purpureus]|uniref:NADH dehydrogenase [ubiquinone] 1 alpha subcomplex subunit 12 n=1 Tax=Ceratodon purpureus TaxID=3225 RepID=A0A8T0GQS5_CERPU|nr:hypothetical protein KC19_9G051600 [Ceratodon purpureus]